VGAQAVNAGGQHGAEYQRIIDTRLKPDLGASTSTCSRHFHLGAYYDRLTREGLGPGSSTRVESQEVVYELVRD